MRRQAWTPLFLLLLLAGARADDKITPEIDWSKSFINTRRDAGSSSTPLVVLFYDRLTVDGYDDVLARDPRMREAAKGFLFVKVERETEKDLARRLGVKSPWEVRVLAPDATVLQNAGSKPKPAELAAALKTLQKAWGARGGPKAIDWIFSYEAGVKLAQEKNRPMLLYFWSDEKKGSSPEENPLLKNEKVIQLSKRFVCIKVNQSVDQPVFDRYKVEQVPTLLLVRPNEEACQPLDVNLKLDVLVTTMKDVASQFDDGTIETGKGQGGQ